LPKAEQQVKRSRIQAAFRGLAECRKCGIRDLVLFSDLTEPDFALVHQPVDEMFIEAGGVLYNEGDTGHWVFTVRSGLVRHQNIWDA
jgi:CRP/FNR family transcriptional regulator, anaerobic regulatory protein